MGSGKNRVLLNVLIGLAVIIGLALAYGFYSERNHVRYDFMYSSTQMVSGTEVSTQVNRCVHFNPKEVSLDYATKKFTNTYAKSGGKLSISDGCLSSFSGEIYESMLIEK